MTPTQELVMEVLAARYRLGENIWTFRTNQAVKSALRALEADDMVFTMHGIVEGTIRAGLTENGRDAFLSPNYRVPEAVFPS